ncbi:HET domain-containing protein [Diaporthe helianthi]|uniref:HET domain-containing protein n=1 Tax=Diaporthe helianthi TaxID=158607 RepID=A0A2P5HV65_DIAHE|nr:HET domain-containing protein [Diaporthe helianthi]
MEVEQDVPASDVSLLYHEYRYEPLIAEDAVRILVLEPADHLESPLCCSITQQRRDSPSRSVSGCDYSAVSYTWGDCELSHQLLVRTDAQSWSCLRITANVDSLLRHFRVPHKARLLWIDAICLNQKDETEKTQQIPLMGRIYNDAKRTRIWLGNDEVDKAQHAFSVIRDIGREDQRKVTREELECLAEFFSRPWFTRRWVIQEAVFSHDAVFHCGTHKLSLSRVMAALRKINGTGDHELVGCGARMLLTSMGSRHVEKKGLLSLLWDFHDSECSDARDRIAAVYGLVTDGVRPLLHYGSMDWKQIYMDMASYFIQNSPSVTFTRDAASVHNVLLHLCHFGPVQSQTDADCPSWVPDWSRRRKSLLPFVLDEPSLYSCEVGRGTYNVVQLNHQTFRILWATPEPPDSAKQERMRMVRSLQVNSPACMQTEVIGEKLRLNYHPLIFFEQCGKVNMVIRCSTGPEFWRQVVEALDIPTILRHRSAELDVYHFYQDSLLGLLAQILVERDREAGETSKGLLSYSEEILEELHAHRDDPEGLSASNSTNLQEISTSLRHVSIVSIQASTRSYWAIGPSVAQVGDWMVPLLLPQQSGFVPMICLRTIDPEGEEIKELQSVSHATGIGERCLRFLGGSVAGVSCLHVKARFVGSGLHCTGRSVDFDRNDYDIMLEIILSIMEAARVEDLPGPVVFDIV